MTRAAPLECRICRVSGRERWRPDEQCNSGIRLSIVELPAVNTPQFDWARVHLSHTPRPMGAPVEPEVVQVRAARARLFYIRTDAPYPYMAHAGDR